MRKKSTTTPIPKNVRTVSRLTHLAFILLIFEPRKGACRVYIYVLVRMTKTSFSLFLLQSRRVLCSRTQSSILISCRPCSPHNSSHLVHEPYRWQLMHSFDALVLLTSIRSETSILS